MVQTPCGLEPRPMGYPRTPGDFPVFDGQCIRWRNINEIEDGGCPIVGYIPADGIPHPDNPDCPSLAVDMTTNRITHYWEKMCSVWVELAMDPKCCPLILTSAPTAPPENPELNRTAYVEGSDEDLQEEWVWDASVQKWKEVTDQELFDFVDKFGGRLDVDLGQSDIDVCGENGVEVHVGSGPDEIRVVGAVSPMEINADGTITYTDETGQQTVFNHTGPQGADGAQGAPGVDGQDGAQGPQGDPGPAGANGQDGADGQDGTDATVVLDPDPCNSLSGPPSALFAPSIVPGSLILQVDGYGSPVGSLANVAAGSDLIVHSGSVDVKNPSDCHGMNCIIDIGLRPGVFHPPFNSTYTSRFFVFVEHDLGGGFVTATFNGYIQSGNTERTHRSNTWPASFTLAPGQTLNIPWRVRVIALDGDGVSVFWYDPHIRSFGARI